MQVGRQGKWAAERQGRSKDGREREREERSERKEGG